MIDSTKPILYTERQGFSFLINFFLILIALYITGNCIDGGYAYVFKEIRFYVILLLFTSPIIFKGIMRIDATNSELVIRYGFISFKGHILPLNDIKSVKLRTVHWPKDFWFYGTYGKDTSEDSHFVRYGKGANITLNQGTLFIGSKNAEKLIQFIKTSIKKKRS